MTRQLAHHRRGLAPLFVAPLFVAACLSQNTPPPVRYFEPERTPATGTRDTGTETAPLRLGRVTAALHLRDRMAWRLSAVELAFDESSRWIADPASLVEAELFGELYERGRFRTSVAGADPVLEVRVEAFEGTLEEPRAARVELVLSLLTEGRSGQETHRIVSEEPLTASGPAALARSMGPALSGAVAEVSSWLEGRE